jgi:hypothetical protein
MGGGNFFVACVADGPRLILSSILLHTSVRYFIPEARVVFGVPEDAQHYKQLEMLADLSRSEIVILPTPGCFSRDAPYRIFNKINLLSRTGNRSVFLCDSDLLFVRKFPVEYFDHIEIGAKVADAMSWQGDWNYVYSKFGLDAPKRRVVTTTTKDISYPYYNSGFIYAREPEALAEAWLYTAEKIASDSSIVDVFPYADQISLPLAFQISGKALTELDVAFNQSIHSIVGNYYVLHHHDYYETLNRIIPALLQMWIKSSPIFAEALNQLKARFSRERKK